jgi:thioredoxin reductase (NADPH)
MREGLDTLVIERAALGGQAGVTQVLGNSPGFDSGVAEEEFARRPANQARRFGAELLEAQEARDIGRDGQYLRVRTADGQEYGARAVLIATGSRYRRLNVPGEDELIGADVHFCATCEGAFYKDREVLVIGGGDSGFEESLFLTRFARQVTIVESQPQVGASAILQDKVGRHDEIRVVTNHAVNAFLVRDDKLNGVLVQNRETGEALEWHPDGVFIFVGMSPNTGFLPVGIECDERGFVRTDSTLMTSMGGVFAPGDVRAGSIKQAASAVGEGATAALMIRQYLETG